MADGEVARCSAVETSAIHMNAQTHGNVLDIAIVAM
jgi:hypothetical protein